MTESIYKRAALRLACLHPADRRWMLRRLPASDRRYLSTLLKELERLGIEDPSLLLAALTKAAPAQENSAAAEEVDPRLLDRLPPVWTMAALSVSSPAAQETYLQRVSPTRRKTLATQAPGSLPPLLAASLRRRLKDSAA